MMKVQFEQVCQILQPLKKLAVSRNSRYGNSIVVMNDVSILQLINMKLIRTLNMLSINQNNDDKWYDEIGDSINYLMYILIRRQNNDYLDKKQNTFKQIIEKSKNTEFFTEQIYDKVISQIKFNFPTSYSNQCNLLSNILKLSIYQCDISSDYITEENYLFIDELISGLIYILLLKQQQNPLPSITEGVHNK